MSIPSLYVGDSAIVSVGTVVFTNPGLDASGVPADDAELVKDWVSNDTSVTLTQGSSGSRPEGDDDGFLGRTSILFDNAEHLSSPIVAQPVRWVMFIALPGSGNRAGIARDTSATTNLAAFQLCVDDA